jgi:hypothetical protein
VLIGRSVDLVVREAAFQWLKLGAQVQARLLGEASADVAEVDQIAGLRIVRAEQEPAKGAFEAALTGRQPQMMTSWV